MKLGIFAATVAFALAACSDGPIDQVAAAPVATAPRYADNGAAALTALRAEKAIKDVAVDPAAPVEWTIAVDDDGTRRYGYAEYVCLVLNETKATDATTDVRIVDSTNARSLGTVHCSDSARLD